MPWCQEAMKDVVSCDKPRGAASTLCSVDVRMGQPKPINIGLQWSEFIGPYEPYPVK
jgi:hypothetical protein